MSDKQISKIPEGATTAFPPVMGAEHRSVWVTIHDTTEGAQANLGLFPACEFEDPAINQRVLILRDMCGFLHSYVNKTPLPDGGEVWWCIATQTWVQIASDIPVVHGFA